MKSSIRILSASLAAALLLPAAVLADGIFVVPKFVWDKHRDINEPTQKAIIAYDAGREDLILQVKYEGPVEEFGWLIPVPKLPTVQLGSMKCFYELSRYTQRLWEPPADDGNNAVMALTAGGAAPPEPPVKVVEIKTAGAYEIAVLAAKDTAALAQWLDANGFYFPTDTTDVMDEYVKQQWYFVAAKINVSKSSGFRLLSTPRQAANQAQENYATQQKLSSGELSPLQISFESDRCVFPLKISSANGKSTKVQVYVLSSEPLLEKGMLEKKLPLVYSNDLAQAVQRAQGYRNMRLSHRQLNASVPLLSMDEKIIKRLSQSPAANPDELLPFAKVTKSDLPDSSQIIPRLAGKSWWLSKQTWTFQPNEMRDLEFAPAIPYFAGMLGSVHGYYAAESLGEFGADALPALLAVMNGSDRNARLKAVSLLNPMLGSNSRNGPIRDPRLTQASLAWITDPEPEVRTAAAILLGDDWNSTRVAPLITALSDDNAEVRWAAESGLEHHPSETASCIPRLRAMLMDTNSGVRGVAFQLLNRQHVSLSRDELLAVFKAPVMGAVWPAYEQLKAMGEKISDSDAMPLLQNEDPNIRGGLGLVILSQNADPEAVEMALPLLHDPEMAVRVRAADTLRALTGEPFGYEQSAEWEKWWTENKTKLVVRPQPEPSPWRPDGRAYHGLGCEQYDSRHFAAALADFRKSCALGSEVQDYSYYRIWLIRARAGEKEAATQELDAYLKKRPAQSPPDWPRQIGLFLAGQLPEADLLQAAVNKNPQTDHEQHCEAYFYAGSLRLIEKDKTGAENFFKQCLGTGVNTFEEYESASAELMALP